VSKKIFAVMPLVRALKDQNPKVRFKAAEALGRLEDIRAIWPRIGTLRDFRDFDTMSGVSWALGKRAGADSRMTYVQRVDWWKKNRARFQ
jgi:HEAT repeat protein